jgi:hypothetical protein
MVNKMTNQTIANTTIQQLGGTGRLSAMINAKNFTYDKDGTLTFSFSGCKKINQVTIELNSKDLYNITFTKYTAGRMNNKTFEYKEPTWKAVKEYEDIYNDQLKSVFEETTGLYLSL